MFENLQKEFLSVFPALKNQPAIFVNMDEFYASHRPVRDNGKSIFLEASLTDKWLTALHKTENVAYSFGGYLEDRANLWAGSYMDGTGKEVHLGIDVNAPAGTDVAPAHNARVAKVIHDPDQDGGWGSVIMFELEKPIGTITHYIYAHLSKDSLLVKPGDAVQAGQTVAKLGKTHENGGWYEHLHVQAMTMDAWNMVKNRNDMSAFDGYDSMPLGEQHHLSPDPAPLLGLRQFSI